MNYVDKQQLTRTRFEHIFLNERDYYDSAVKLGFILDKDYYSGITFSS